jgi:hypothetical protein
MIAVLLATLCVPLSGLDVAVGKGQIRISVQAGGIAKALIRLSSSGYFLKVAGTRSA